MVAPKIDNKFKKLVLTDVNDAYPDLLIYDGQFDLNSSGKNISLNLSGDTVSFNLDDVINSNNILLDNMTVESLRELCLHTGLRAVVYSRRTAMKKLESSTDELKSCFVDKVTTASGAELIVCIAFGEKQPTLYQAELVAVLAYVI